MNLLVSLLLGLTLGQTPPTQTAPQTKNTYEIEVEVEEKDEPRFLDSLLGKTALGQALGGAGISISGWTEASFTASSARFDHLPMGFNYRANEFLIQQNWLRMERAVDAKADAPSWGFRSDTILPGSDYRFTVARGLYDKQLTDNNGEPATYGVDPVQFYAELQLPTVGNGLNLKFGRFFAQYGVESNDTTANQLASRCYAFFYNPFTHTGALATLALDDDWSVQAGAVLGSDVFFDSVASATFIGSVKYAPADCDTSLQVSTILGDGRFDVGENLNHLNVIDLVLIHKLTDDLKWTSNAIFSWQENVPSLGTIHAWALVNYLTKDFSEKLSGTVRGEIFNDENGQRTGSIGTYTALTAGLFFKSTKNLWLRPELRYDINSRSLPYQNERALFTAAMDVVVRW